jgi:uncharacterized membrane protein
VTAFRYNRTIARAPGIAAGARRATKIHASGESTKVRPSRRAGSIAGVKGNLSLVMLVGIYWSLALLEPWDLSSVASEWIYYLQGTAWLAFVLIHGTKRYGWDNLFVFSGITLFVSWSAETVSLATGIPFGAFHYTGLLGVKAGAVPLAVLAAYFVAGYLAWTMGTLFLGELGAGIKRRNLLLVPVIAGLLMVVWDLCLDPIQSTIEGAWVWEGGGAYHGVPLANFLGWFLTVFLSCLLFAVYLNRARTDRPVVQNRIYWSLAPVMYLGLALPYLFHPFYQTEHLEIYWSSFLVSILTMVPASVLSIVRVSRMDDGGFPHRP